MRLSVSLCVLAALAACISDSDVDVTVAKAISIINNTQPEFYSQSIALAQVDDCDVTLNYVGPIPTGEAGTFAVTTFADMKRLDYENASIEPNLLAQSKGVLLAIPYTGAPFPQTIRTTDTAVSFQEYVANTGRGSCVDATCEMTWEAPHLLFRIDVNEPEPAAETILAALTEVGAACRATGL
jgi:hypothetical protein